MAEVCPVKRFKNILLSTDRSEFSEGAIREGINLAKRCSGKLYVISVVETNPEFETLAPALVEKAEKEAKEHLDLIRELALKEGVETEVIVRQGDDPCQLIIEEATKRQFDLIIMGRRGRTGFKRLMMGSVTACVVGRAPQNVLVVPRAAHIEWKKILIPTDGSKYSEAATNEALSIAKTCGSSIVAISVVPSESISPFDIVHSEMQKDLIVEKEYSIAESAIKNIKEKCNKEGINCETLLLAGRPYEAIIEIAMQKKVDLIVMGSHGRTGLKKLLMGSVAERVITLSPCAVLVVKTS